MQTQMHKYVHTDAETNTQTAMFILHSTTINSLTLVRTMTIMHILNKLLLQPFYGSQRCDESLNKW